MDHNSGSNDVVQTSLNRQEFWFKSRGLNRHVLVQITCSNWFEPLDLNQFEPLDLNHAGHGSNWAVQITGWTGETEPNRAKYEPNRAMRDVSQSEPNLS